MDRDARLQRLMGTLVLSKESALYTRGKPVDNLVEEPGMGGRQSAPNRSTRRKAVDKAAPIREPPTSCQQVFPWCTLMDFGGFLEKKRPWKRF